MNKIAKRGLICLLFFIITAVLVIIALFVKQGIVDGKINDDISWIYSGEKYKTPVSIDGVGVIKQDISCGYACIELLSRWQGGSISESDLLSQNGGKITTAIGSGFVNEVNKQFPEFHTTKHSNLTNSELIDMVYNSLEKGIPVPFEFAALYTDDEESVWTLHFAIITAMDIGDDKIVISNPYGYTESYSIDDFLSATRYDSYEEMGLLFKLGFAAGAFKKNTIYILDSV